ncbi:CBS domain-containing protein [Dactylosporangium fulvum]|uniref:CBS domain-containing protein n=1 Tax=Dactylosporangium fulvum TaxID=53359 RepID=A0ABY5VMU5_9ACTN|nr:CBS domain-containing protein [Dactylosporangium fulvum]UWP79042.1 CBS domain-containing protein [Dactylosporangium fulvum]
MSQLAVRDVMTPAVLVVTPDCRYEQIVGVLTGYGVSGLPVVDGSDHVLGVVSEADVLRPHGGATARELMTSPAVTVDAAAPVDCAAELMARHRIRRLPVTGATGRLVGIVTRRDLLCRAGRTDATLRRTLVPEVLVQHYRPEGTDQ